MDVVPIASEGNRKNENDDHDEADILQPLVWRRRNARTSTLAVVQYFDHGAIVVELMRLCGWLAGNDYIYSAIISPAFRRVITANGMEFRVTRCGHELRLELVADQQTYGCRGPGRRQVPVG